jgi:antitoxin VapB
MQRLRWVGNTSHMLLAQVAREIQPGMSELEIAARIQEAYTRNDMTLDVLIVGVDERISHYRHPLPTRRVLERYALLHPAARRWGLHANITRLVHFGPPPDAIQRAVDGVLTIEGRIMGMLSEGVYFAQILAEQKQWYAEVGFPEDWKYHFQGGTTGYIAADPTHSLNPTAMVKNYMAFDYFVTITGAKAENLSLLTADGIEIASKGENWPMRSVRTLAGEIEVPDMLIH